MAARGRSHRILRVVTGAVLLVALTALAMILGSRPQTLASAHPIDASAFGRRVLVIVPHPDDEVLTAGGLIQQLLASGARVRVVIVTAGDGYFSAARRLSPSPVTPGSYIHLGDVRHGESLKAAARLGLPDSDLIELGFPDTGTPALWDGDWAFDQTQVGRTGRASVPYEWAYAPGTPYCGERLAAQLTEIIRDFAPTSVVSPDTHETHPDHFGVATFTLLALDEAGFTGRHFTTIVHYPWYPYPLGFLEHDMLEPPPTLIGDGSTWCTLGLDPAQSKTTREALDQYRSQELVFGRAVPLRSFVRRNELFNERPAGEPYLASDDGAPSPGTTGTIVVMRYPGRTLAQTPSVRIDSIRMVRGPHRTWIGLECSRAISPRDHCRVQLRLAGWRQIRRIDIAVAAGVAIAQRIDTSAVLPAPVVADAHGTTVWVGLPSDALAGYRRAIIGASAGPPGQTPFRTAWRDVAL